MRAALDLDEQLFLTVKEIARQQNTTTGEIISRLLREALQFKSFDKEYRNGVRSFPASLRALR